MYLHFYKSAFKKTPHRELEPATIRFTSANRTSHRPSDRLPLGQCVRLFVPSVAVAGITSCEATPASQLDFSATMPCHSQRHALQMRASPRTMPKNPHVWAWGETYPHPRTQIPNSCGTLLVQLARHANAGSRFLRTARATVHVNHDGKHQGHHDHIHHQRGGIATRCVVHDAHHG